MFSTVASEHQVVECQPTLPPCLALSIWVRNWGVDAPNDSSYSKMRRTNFASLKANNWHFCSKKGAGLIPLGFFCVKFVCSFFWPGSLSSSHSLREKIKAPADPHCSECRNKCILKMDGWIDGFFLFLWYISVQVWRGWELTGYI